MEFYRVCSGDYPVKVVENRGPARHSDEESKRTTLHLRSAATGDEHQAPADSSKRFL